MTCPLTSSWFVLVFFWFQLGPNFCSAALLYCGILILDIKGYVLLILYMYDEETVTSAHLNGWKYLVCYWEKLIGGVRLHVLLTVSLLYDFIASVCNIFVCSISRHSLTFHTPCTITLLANWIWSRTCPTDQCDIMAALTDWPAEQHRLGLHSHCGLNSC